MKRILIAATTLILCWGSAQAQDFRLGLKAGYNHANVSGNMGMYQDFDRDRRPGFHAGLLGNVSAGDRLGVQAELNYSTKGFRIDDTRLSNNDNTRTRTEIKSQINYLDLPVLVQLKGASFFMEAGPQFSFLLNQKTHREVTTEEKGLLGNWEEPERSPAVTTTSTSGYKPLDAGIAVGLGLRSENSPISFGIRYSNSLSSIFEDTKTNARNSVLQVTLSSYLPFFGE